MSLPKSLKAAHVEKDVENAYRAEISNNRPGTTWTSPHNTDGLGEWDVPLKPGITVRLLLEAKLDKDFGQSFPIYNTLAQMVLYLRAFETAGDKLPNVLFVGDKNECFVLSTNKVAHFLQLNIDWTRAPSSGSPELVRAMTDAGDITPYVFNIEDADFDFREVLAKIEGLAEGMSVTVRASKTNLFAMFLYWRDQVFRQANSKVEKGISSLPPNDQVNVFLTCLFDEGSAYLHPKKLNRLVVDGYDGGGVPINTKKFQSFFDHFSRGGYSQKEVTTFRSMQDQLVEDTTRRMKGEFFTPDLWVEEAHREVEKSLGPDWRKDCVVWDCAAGTGNLTRNKRDWGCLISSTVEAPDIKAMKNRGWGGKHVFQHDFLNDNAPSPLFPEGQLSAVPKAVQQELRAQAAAGKRLVFFINPPYGTAGVFQTYETEGTQQRSTLREGIAKTAVNEQMKAAKLGAPSQQLYAQFMFQCRQVAEQYGFVDYTVALFSKPTFMSSGSYRKFRNWWYGGHHYEGGFLFQASHFADVSGRWGISFTVWSGGGGSMTRTDVDLPARLADVADFAVVRTGGKTIYNSDGREASKWAREPARGKKGVDVPQMSSGLKVSQKGSGKWCSGALGYMADKSNCLMYSNDETYWLPSPSSRNRGYPVLPSNWRRAVALYGARKLVKGDWINDKDEYLVPYTALPGYEQWVDDCHVYALLHRANNCTAMRDVNYKGKSWRIKNNWFWKTRAEVEAAADRPKCGLIYSDAQHEQDDAYFAKLLADGKLNLSADAQEILDDLNELWEWSLPFREEFYAEQPITDKKPDLHLMAHDAGVYQLKHLWRAHFPDRWAAVKKKHKKLAKRLAEGVYTYRFLKK